MLRVRTMVAACAAAALLATALAGPVASASRTKMAIVNGDPFRKVDICVNGKKVGDNVPYGGYVLKTTATAGASVRFLPKRARSCRSRRLAKVYVRPADSLVVFTRKYYRRVVVLKTTVFADSDAAAFLLHAADTGQAKFATDFYQDPDWNYVTAAPSDPGWSKGQGGVWYNFNESPGTTYFDGVTVFANDERTMLVEPKIVFSKEGRRRDFIYVGTNDSNDKLVVVSRRLPIVP